MAIQKIIPSTNTSVFLNKKPTESRKLVLEIYKQKYLDGLSVVNIDTGIKIFFDNAGGRKTAMGGNIYPKKSAIIQILKPVIKNMVYNNWGKRKIKDDVNVLGYLNFKCKVRIDNKIENLRVTIKQKKDGKYYYNLEINIYKKPTG